MQDHHASRKADFLADGHDEAAAEALALEALGPPEVVAASAAENLWAHFWSARHPYLFSVAFGGGVLVFNVALIVGIALAAGDPRSDDSEHWLAAEAAVSALNWLTPLAGGGVLFWIARRFPVGWKTLISASVGLALAVSMIGVWYIPRFAPGYGPPDHHITLVLINSPVGSLGMLCEGEYSHFFHSLLNYGAYETLLSSGRLLLPVFAALGFRYVVIARYKNSRSSTPPTAIS